jgi:AcrR family transcriptional regulator
MMTEVKRTYDATNRQQRARERRRAVVQAAQELFERDGFRATTIAAVARTAGVSAESIYKGFGTKAALAKAVFDFVIAGDDEPVPMLERPEIQTVRSEPDPGRKLALYAEGLASRQHRSAKVQLLIRDGRHVDDTLEEVWQKLLAERLHGMTMLATELHATGRLRPGLDVDEVRDILWTYISVELYELLVLNRGWPVARYTTWLSDALIAALCP